MSSRKSVVVEKHRRSRNVALSLRYRSMGLRGCNMESDMLHAYGETCAAVGCTDNHKVPLPPRTRSTFMTAFSPNFELMASCHGDHNVHVTNLLTGKVTKSLIGHERSPWCISFHPSCNDIVATGCLNGEVRVWDLHGGGSESWTSTSSDQVTITSLSFHPTDHVLLIASGNEIHLWDWSCPKPFVSIKTNSSQERVQLVRFEAHGTRILTGIVNHEDNRSGDDDDEEAGEPSSPLAGQQRNLTSRNGVWLNSWFNNAPAFSVGTRSPTSRPLTASYNLRGRHDARSAVATESTVSTSSNNDPLHSLPRLVDLRPRVSDVTHAHTYSRDHQRILHAHVSVHEQIQHHYRRLQQLLHERRRYEVRLRQLRHHQASFGEPGALPSRPPASEEIGESSSMHGSLQALEREAISDYNDITTVLAARVQSHLIRSLNDRDIEVSIDWRSPSTSGAASSSANPPETSSSFHPVLGRFHRNSNHDDDGARQPAPSSPRPPHLESPNFAPIALNSRTSAARPLASNVPLNSSYIPRRIRRAAAVRRMANRRRNYFTHMWPVPEGYQGIGDKTSYRLQWFDFSRLEMPEISRNDINVVVRHCKIHNDSSVDVSKDGRKVAALIWSENPASTIQVGVFSLVKSNQGQLLFRKSFDPSQNAVCLSLSPLGNYLAVGLKFDSFISEGLQGRRGTVAEVLKLGKLEDPLNHIPVHHIVHPSNPDTPSRYARVNTIAWLPHVGQGLVYGTNNGELRLCFTSTRPKHASDPSLSVNLTNNLLNDLGNDDVNVLRYVV